MRNIISFMHISLDGFVAGPNGEMNWITINEELFAHIGERIAATDTALYGRTTYQMMEAYWPTAADRPNASAHDKQHSAWYGQAHKLVVSESMKNMELPRTTFISGDLTANLRYITEQEGSEILLFGSPSTTHALLQLNLINGYWLFVNPVILGKGIPLFPGNHPPSKLLLKQTRTFNSGVTELRYLVNG
jgi:dihydrofolate reductase